MTHRTGLTAVSASEEPTPGFNHKIPDKIMTPDSVDTSIGTLEFFDGMPSDSTLTKVFDNLDLIRGVDTFLNGIPATSMEGLHWGSSGPASTPATRSSSSR